MLRMLAVVDVIFMRRQACKDSQTPYPSASKFGEHRNR